MQIEDEKCHTNSKLYSVENAIDQVDLNKVAENNYQSDKEFNMLKSIRELESDEEKSVSS